MNRPLAELSNEELEKGAWHDLSVAHLVELHNPLCAWAELGSPLTVEEVQACLEAGQEELCHTPLWTALIFGKEKLPPEEVRRRHVAKVAYFVRHEAQDPISIDVGVPSLGCRSDCLVGDGNHRLAGAWIAQRATVRASVCGSIDHAQEMGLWNPNAHAQELGRRWALEDAQRKAAASATASRKPRGPGR